MNAQHPKKPNASVAIQMLPKVTGDETLRIVDAVIDYIRQSGLPYQVGPFETTIEGDYDVLMDIVRECALICVRQGAPGVLGYVKLSYCPDGVWTMDEKTAKHLR